MITIIETCCFCCSYCISLNDSDELVDYFDGVCLFLKTYVRYEWGCDLGQVTTAFIGG